MQNLHTPRKEKMKNDHRYVLYARKSSESKERQIASIDDQIAENKEYALREGLKIVKVIQESKSAFKPHLRAGFDEMLEFIADGSADSILTWKPDRISRNPEEGGKIVQLLQDGKLKQIRTPSECYEPDSDHLVLQMHFGMSNQYSRTLSQNVKRGMKHKVARGEYPRRAPIGYVSRGERGRKNIYPHPTHGETVRMLFELAASGEHSLSDLAEIAFERGLTTQSGKQLGKSHIQSILTNTLYYGYFTYSGELFQGSYEPLVNKKLFEQAQVGLENRSKPRVHEWDDHHLLNGLMTCGECGAAITTTIKKKHYPQTKRTALYHYNHCTHRKGACSQKPISMSEMQGLLSDALSQIAIDEEVWQLGMELFRAKHKEESQNNLRRLTYFQKQYEALQSKLDRLIDMRASEELTREEFIHQKNMLVQDQAKVQGLIDDAKDSSTSWLEEAQAFLDTAFSAKDIMRQGTLAQKRELIMTVGENLTMKDKKIDIQFKKPYDVLLKYDLRTSVLRLVDAFCNHKIEFSVNLQLLQNFFTDWQLTPSFA